jgi:hypothetical protein
MAGSAELVADDSWRPRVMRHTVRISPMHTAMATLGGVRLGFAGSVAVGIHVVRAGAISAGLNRA